MKHYRTAILRNVLIGSALVLFAVLCRLAPHPANFAPIAAVALLAGTLLPMRWAVAVTLSSMMASDLVIGLHGLVLITWGSFALVALLGNRLIKGRLTSGRIIVGSLGASVLFFVLTNFGVWVEGKLYAHTLEGLWQCYANALPFFRNTVLGDLIYCGVLFGGYLVAVRIWQKYRKSVLASVS